MVDDASFFVHDRRTATVTAVSASWYKPTLLYTFSFQILSIRVSAAVFLIQGIANTRNLFSFICLKVPYVSELYTNTLSRLL